MSENLGRKKIVRMSDEIKKITKKKGGARCVVLNGESRLFRPQLLMQGRPSTKNIKTMRVIWLGTQGAAQGQYGHCAGAAHARG
jgi:hypothetical protein